MCLHAAMFQLLQPWPCCRGWGVHMSQNFYWNTEVPWSITGTLHACKSALWLVNTVQTHLLLRLGCYSLKGAHFVLSSGTVTSDPMDKGPAQSEIFWTVLCLAPHQRPMSFGLRWRGQTAPDNMAPSIIRALKPLHPDEAGVPGGLPISRISGHQEGPT